MGLFAFLVKPLAYLSVPFILGRSLVTSTSPTTRYYARIVLYFSAMTVVASCSLFIAAGMSLAGQKYDVNWVVARIFHMTAGRLVDIEVEVEGEEHLQTKPAVMLGNHQSVVDILLLGRMFPKRAVMVAKQELRFTPLGPWMTMSGAVWLDRGNNARAIRSLEAAGEQMKQEKLSLWLFPEGTRHLSETPDLLPFKKGGFHLAVQSGLPIVPVVFENYWRLYHKGCFEGGKLKIRILPPIPTAGLSASDVGELAQNVREQMMKALREISVKTPAASASGSERATVQAGSSGVKEPAVDASSELKTATLGLGDAPDVNEPPRAGESGASGDSLSTNPGSASDIGAASPSKRTYEPSETGTETEEDEGMVLVGRPL